MVTVVQASFMKELFLNFTCFCWVPSPRIRTQMEKSMDQDPDPHNDICGYKTLICRRLIWDLCGEPSSHLECGKLSRLVIFLLTWSVGNWADLWYFFSPWVWETEQTCDISSHLKCGKLSRLVIFLLTLSVGNWADLWYFFSLWVWETEQTCDISPILECGKLSRLVIFPITLSVGNWADLWYFFLPWVWETEQTCDTSPRRWQGQSWTWGSCTRWSWPGGSSRWSR